MMAYLSLIWIFFRIGLFGFGGGYAMLPLIFQSVQSFGVMTAEDFSNLVALSQVTPGPVAVNAAIFVGFHYVGFFGAVCATFGVALPSFLLVITVSRVLTKFKESKIVKAIFTGIRPATVGLIAAAAIFIGKTSLVTGTQINWVPCVIFIVTMILIAKCKMSPIVITLLMGTIGAFVCG